MDIVSLLISGVITAAATYGYVLRQKSVLAFKRRVQERLDQVIRGY